MGKSCLHHTECLAGLAFSNLEDQIYLKQDKMGIKQLLFICTFQISNWFVTRVKFGSDWDGKIVFTPYRMFSWLSFFKPRRPNLPQVGQNGYQTTPLHLYIPNIKLVCDLSQVWVGLEWENRVYTIPNV